MNELPLRGRRARGMLRLAAAVAIAAAAVTSLAACGAHSTSGSAAETTTLTAAATVAPLSLDPGLNGAGAPMMWYTRLAYDPLIIGQVDGSLKPGLATDWAYSADRLSFVLNLRKDVTFSDGDALTAQAVVDSLSYFKKNSVFTSALASVASITATGPLQVTLGLSQPDPMLPLILDQQNGGAGFIISPTGLKTPASLGTETHGAGPYILDKSATVTNSSYVYTPNPTYWNKSSVHYKKIVIKVIANDNSALAAMKTGQVQIAIGSSSVQAAAKSAGLTITSAKAAMIGVYFFDLAGKINPAFGDVRVRQALNYAVDRAGITKAVFGSSGSPTAQYVTDGTGGFVSKLDSAYAYDPAKAKQLLAEAGYPDGFSFKLLTPPGSEAQGSVDEALVEEWGKVGVKVDISAPATVGDWVGDIKTGQYVATGFNLLYTTQIGASTVLFTKGASYNVFGNDDPQLAKLVDAERAYDIDSKEGIAAAEAAETYLVKNAFAVPVTASDTLLLSTKAVAGVEFSEQFTVPDPTTWKPAS